MFKTWENEHYNQQQRKRKCRSALYQVRERELNDRAWFRSVALKDTTRMYGDVDAGCGSFMLGHGGSLSISRSPTARTSGSLFSARLA